MKVGTIGPVMMTIGMAVRLMAGPMDNRIGCGNANTAIAESRMGKGCRVYLRQKAAFTSTINFITSQILRKTQYPKLTGYNKGR